MSFDGSSIDGYSRIQEADVLAVPDPNTFEILPWVDNKAAEGVAGMLLDQGKLTPDKWGEAFSMFEKPHYETLITRGLQGEIAAGRLKTNDDLSRILYTAVNQYKDFLGDTPDATNA